MYLAVPHDWADHCAALGHLVVVLRAQGAIALLPVSTTSLEEEVRRYNDHMDCVRVLSPDTRTLVLKIVGLRGEDA